MYLQANFLLPDSLLLFIVGFLLVFSIIDNFCEQSTSSAVFSLKSAFERKSDVSP